MTAARGIGVREEWAAICRDARSDVAAIRAGSTRAQGDLAAATQRVLALADTTTPLSEAACRDAEAQGAFAALLLGRLRERLVPFWLGLGGPGFAIASAMFERRSIATHPRAGAGLDLRVRWLEPRPKERIPVSLDGTTWETLSLAFRKLRKAERALAQAEVREHIKRARPSLGLALWVDGIALLSEEAASHTTLALAISEPMRTELEPWVIAAVPALAETPSKATRAAALDILQGAPLTIVNRIARHAKEVVGLLKHGSTGSHGIRPLLELLSEAHKTSVVEATAAKRVAEALATIDDAPIVMEFFRRHIESRLIGSVAAEYVVTKKQERKKAKENDKDDAQDVDAPPSSHAHPSSARAAEILEAVTEEKNIRSKRAKKAAKKVATTRKRSSIVAQAAEATDDVIPWILREPPWRHPSSVPPLPAIEPRVPSLDRIAFEDRLHLTDDDRAGIDEGAKVDDDDAVGMLASRGLSALPAILAMPIADGIHGLRHVESPRILPSMLDALTTPRRAVAHAYLRKHPEVSALGLIAIVLAEDSPPKKRRDALEAMNLLLRVEEGGPPSRQAQEKILHAAAAELGPQVSEAMPAVLRAARLLDLNLDTGARPSVPSWADHTKLPPILLRPLSGDRGGGSSSQRLPAAALETLLELLTFPNAKHPHVAALRELRGSLEQVALDVFLTALLDKWIRSKSWTDEWVLFAVSTLGGPDSHRAIMQRAKEWNREHATRSSHLRAGARCRFPPPRDRALLAIQALGAGGSGAISILTELTRKGGSTSLTECAREVLATLARSEGLTTDELADIGIPTLDLDQRGCMVLDFGPRTFEIRLGDDLAAQIIDERGQRVTTALRKLASDDPVKAQMSLERLKSLKKSMGEVARNVAARLELAMITGRTWSGRSFRTMVVDHPLLGRIARRLVWSKRSRGERGERGDLLFRIAEDGTAADAKDVLVSIEEGDVIRIVHTFELSDDAKRTWGDIFAEYEIIQPFPQIARATFTPTASEVKSNELDRWRGRDALQMAIQGRLMARGWERVVGEEGATDGYVRRLRSVTAHYTLVHQLFFSNSRGGGSEDGEEFVNETVLGSVSFGATPLASVPPIVFSEIAYDLHVLGEEKV